MIPCQALVSAVGSASKPVHWQIVLLSRFAPAQDLFFLAKHLFLAARPTRTSQSCPAAYCRADHRQTSGTRSRFSNKKIVTRSDRRAVAERDDLVWAAETGVNRPLVAHTNLGERGPLGGRAEANESQRVAGAGAVAREVDDGVAIGLPAVEHERVVARTTDEDVGTASAIKRIVAGVAEDRIDAAVARGLHGQSLLQDRVVHIRGQRVGDRGVDRVVARTDGLDHQVADI